MVNLILTLTNSWINNTGLWGKLIGLFYNLFHNMGWTIVVFTICLKIVLIPLDIYQRSVSTKMTQKQIEMQPDLDKIQKIYKDNPEELNKRTMQIYKDHNFNVGSSCLGMLINLVLTLVIFFTLFSALRTISSKMIVEQYEDLRETYVTAYVLNGDSNERAQQAVLDRYKETKQSWLWIKNIYLADTNVEPFLEFNDFVTKSGIDFSTYLPLEYDFNVEKNNGSQEGLDVESFKLTGDAAKAQAKIDYEAINGLVIQDTKGKWNGLYILIILSGVITWLSTKVTKIGQPKQKQKVQLADGTIVEKEVDPMGIMNLMLPLMMIFFTYSYTGLFAIYIVMNSLVSIVVSLGFVLVKKYIVKPKKKLAEESLSSDYRYNKYSIIEDNNIQNDNNVSKKGKK